MKFNHICAIVIGIGMLLCPGLLSAESRQDEAASAQRRQAVAGCFGTYDAAPRLANGHVDIDRLLGELADMHAQTYNWLVWHGEHDWKDLQQFLPRARKQKIQVWVSLVPPSESPPHAKQYSEPFKLDYERWAAEIARLSLREPNLVAWSIDDFAHNLDVYTPEQTRKMVEAARAINPRLAFVPCIYYRQATVDFAAKYKDSLDGVLFPYRNESIKANLTDAGAVAAEVKYMRELFGPSMLVIIDVYATAHSTLGASTPEYVRQVMTAGHENADGVLIYCHQDRKQGAAKFEVMSSLFGRWNASPASRPH